MYFPGGELQFRNQVKGSAHAQDAHMSAFNKEFCSGPCSRVGRKRPSIAGAAALVKTTPST